MVAWGDDEWVEGLVYLKRTGDSVALMRGRAEMMRGSGVTVEARLVQG